MVERVRAALLVLAAVLLGSPTALAAQADEEGTPVTVEVTSPTAGDVVLGTGFTIEGTASVSGDSSEPDTSIVYVLDTSGSTSNPAGVDCDVDVPADTVLDCEKAAVEAVVERAEAPGSTILNSGLAAFDSDGSPVVHLTQDDSALLAGLGTLSSSGGTDFTAGLHAANDILNSVLAAPKAVIVFLTDGVGSATGLPTLPPDTTVHAFAIGAATCSSELLAVVATSTSGTGSCTVVTSGDLDSLGHFIGEASFPAVTGLTVEIDGVALQAGQVTIDPPLSGDPSAIGFTAEAPGLGEGTHEVCVTASGDGPDGPGEATDCRHVEVVEVVADCTESCTVEVSDDGTADARFTASGLDDKSVGLRVRETGATDCGTAPCITGFDVLFASTSPARAQGVGELTVTFEPGVGPAPGRAEAYIDGQRVTARCTGTAPALPCYTARRVAGARTEMSVRFDVDPGVTFR